MAANVTLRKNLSHDPLTSFLPVHMMAESPDVFVAFEGAPFNSVPEFIAYARKHPGKVTYSSAGVGTGTHLVAALFKTVTGVDMLHVPYKGSALGWSWVDLPQASEAPTIWCPGRGAAPTPGASTINRENNPCKVECSARSIAPRPATRRKMVRPRAPTRSHPALGRQQAGRYAPCFHQFHGLPVE